MSGYTIYYKISNQHLKSLQGHFYLYQALHVFMHFHTFSMRKVHKYKGFYHGNSFRKCFYVAFTKCTRKSTNVFLVTKNTKELFSQVPLYMCHVTRCRDW